MGLPQQRFPSPALPAGPAAAGCRPELRGQNWALLPAMGLCHFALALLVLLEVVAQVDTQKMVRAQCGAHPQACSSIHFLLLPVLPLSHGLQCSQKQHQVCRDGRLKAGSKKCPSEKTTAWAKYPHRVSDSLSQLTPDTSHPTVVRPDLHHWPESQGMDSLQKQDLRRPKIHGSVRVSPYQPPTLASLQRLLWVRRAAMLNHVNEVWPNLFLGDAYAARDKNKLTQLGITHVVNVAAGKFQVDTGAKFYRGMPLEYYGIEADDNPFFDLSVYFLPVARYIRSALSVPQGDCRSTDPHHAGVAKDARCKGSALDQEKGIPAAALSPATNMLCDLERAPFLSGLSSEDSVSMPGCCDSWAEASLTPSRTGA
ncbi:dual specificity protein phosphatase 13B isoform X3 [Ovis canadensis]|uniref:dual specificity protein phosphatase 13B isoform X3 n=1 Tax=Ovis canadensis TaxID=37174 RepID=UPI00374FF44F